MIHECTIISSSKAVLLFFRFCHLLIIVDAYCNQKDTALGDELGICAQTNDLHSGGKNTEDQNTDHNAPNLS